MVPQERTTNGRRQWIFKAPPGHPCAFESQSVVIISRFVSNRLYSGHSECPNLPRRNNNLESRTTGSL
jgi:hypothetical protein